MRIALVSNFLTAKSMNTCAQHIVKKMKLGRDICFECVTHNGGSKEEFTKTLDNYEVILADPALISEHVHSINNVKWIASTFAGVDEVIIAVGKRSPSFVFTRMGMIYSKPMSEYVIAHIIAHEKQLFQSHDDQRNSLWNMALRKSTRSTSTLKIGILGVGDIGKTIAETCKFFGMTVYGLVTSKPEGSRRSPSVDKYFVTEELHELLGEVDYVCNILPNTPETHYLLSESTFKYCQEKQAVFINIGRGNICKEQDILSALDKGYISHAILDVYEKEPLPTNSGLWTHPRVTCTPHNSGYADAKDVAKCFLENLQRFLNGDDLMYRVTWDKPY